jgi:hypothetical protein
MLTTMPSNLSPSAKIDSPKEKPIRLKPSATTTYHRILHNDSNAGDNPKDQLPSIFTENSNFD